MTRSCLYDRQLRPDIVVVKAPSALYDLMGIQPHMLAVGVMTDIVCALTRPSSVNGGVEV